MLEITNRLKGVIQLVIRSKVENGNFVTLSIPGVGTGHNVYRLEDELVTEYVLRAKENKQITTRYVNETVTEGV